MISPHLARPGFLRDQAILVLLLLWAFLVSCTALSSMDIWWHLRTGQLMLERGSVPLSDWYTYTDPDRPWTDLHWGFQLLVVVLHRLGGVSLLIIVKALCVAVAVLFGWLAVRRAPPDECHALCWIPAIVCVSGRSLVRPEMLSLVLLGVSLWMVSRAPTCRTALRWLPLVLLVWVNCHGLFVLGLVVFACLAIDVFMPLRFRGPLRLAEPSATGVDRATVVRMAAVCVAACLANPYFEEGALFPLQLYHKFSVDRALYAGVGEFQRPIEFVRRYGLFSNVYLVSEAALWLATALSFVPAIRQRRLSLTRLLMFAAFSHLAWIASRNTGVFALVSAVVLSSNLGEGRVVRDPTVGIARYGRCASAIVLVALSVGVITGHWGSLGGEDRFFSLRERENWYAHAACRFAGRPGMPSAAFVSRLGQAGVYVYHNGSDRRVYADGRLEVIRRRTYRSYLSICRLMTRGDSLWVSRVQDPFGKPPVVILDNRHARSMIRGVALTGGWRLVYADAIAAVFVTEQVARNLGLPPADAEPLLTERDRANIRSRESDR